MDYIGGSVREDEITATPPSRVRRPAAPAACTGARTGARHEVLSLTASHREDGRGRGLSRRHEVRHDRSRRAVDAALKGQRDHAIGAEPAGRRLVLQDARRRIVGEGHSCGRTRRGARGDDDGCRTRRRPFHERRRAERRAPRLGGFLPRKRQSQQRRLGERRSEELQADRQTIGVNPAGMEIAGSPVTALS